VRVRVMPPAAEIFVAALIATPHRPPLPIERQALDGRPRARALLIRHASTCQVPRLLRRLPSEPNAPPPPPPSCHTLPPAT